MEYPSVLLEHFVPIFHYSGEVFHNILDYGTPVHGASSSLKHIQHAKTSDSCDNSFHYFIFIDRSIN